MNKQSLPTIVLLLLILFCIDLAQGDQNDSTVSVGHLRCEDRENPLGVDRTHPLLSWWLKSDQRNVRQEAYQILVASGPALLSQDKGDLWDSGKVASDNAIQIPYQGKPLSSSQRVFWKVRAWDQSGSPTAWSDVASWTMGVMSPNDWKPASWIGRKDSENRVEETDGYALHGFHSKPVSTPEGEHWVQINFKDAVDFDRIVLLPMTHQNVAGFGFPWRFKIEVSNADNFKNPKTVVDQTMADVPNPGAKPQEFGVKGAGVKTVRITATRLPELSGAKAGENFAWALDEIQLFSGENNVALGQNVTASSSVDQFGWGRQALTRGAHTPEYVAALEREKKLQAYSIRLRREFSVKPGLLRALWHGCGLGHAELEINGQAATPDRLTPGWTNYRKTVLYDTRDITPFLKEGENALGLTLAGGMYQVPKTSRYTKFKGSFGPLQAIGELVLEYKDGSRETIVTDGTWQQGKSPIVFNTIYGGEDYDARMEQEGWTQSGFKPDSSWQPAAVLDGPGGELRGVSHAAAPIREIEVLKSVRTKDISPNVRVYDFGQNAAIVPRLSVHGPAGSSVKITPSELINAQDDIVDTMCGGRSFCVYTLTGKGTETWRPQFYYRGARYFRVEAIPAAPGGELPVVENLEGVVQHSSASPIGSFSCSNELFNRIYRLVRWAQRSNMMSLLTDCPQREKLGWLEEAHLNGPALRYNFDLNPLFGKITRDMVDAQTTDGLVPDTAPEYVVMGGGFRDSPEWGSAIALVPWQQHEFTGDLSLLASAYESIERYVAYLGSKAKEGILDYGLGDWYDIGPKPPNKAQLTPVALTATAFYYQDAEILHRTALLLGKKEDAQKYAALASQIREAFNKKFFDAATHQYATGSQCANSIPLVMNLVPSADRAAVLENIVKDVQEKGLTAGDVGYRYLLRALADGGRSDVIYKLNNQSEKPGYGMQLARGATALTEAWDALPSSSQNHFMLGQINEWLFHDLAGIQPDPDHPGFFHIFIKPAIVGDLTWLDASYESAYGPIRCRWDRKGDELTLAVTIPANTMATISVPTSSPDQVQESGLPVSKTKGIKILRAESGALLLEVGSGKYQFTSHL
ncbi:MAG: family 78 glycoside hydrolase catalytic domain [bacterium]